MQTFKDYMAWLRSQNREVRRAKARELGIPVPRGTQKPYVKGEGKKR